VKKVLALCVMGAALSCSATEVVVTGYGKSYQSALDNAKVAAVDKANGLWLNSEQKVTDGKHSERIVTYSGGVLTKFDIVSSTSDSVTIKADVQPREKNGMSTNSVNIPPSMRREVSGRIDNQKRLKDAVSSLNDKNKALSIIVSDVSYSEVGTNTKVTLTGKISYNQKWLEDLRELSQQVGVKGGTFEEKPDYYGIALTSLAGQVSPIAGGASAVAFAANKPSAQPSRSSYQMVCLDDCYMIGEDLEKLQTPTFLTIKGFGAGEVFRQTVVMDDVRMVDYIPVGTTVDGRWGRKRIYQNPAAVILKDKVVDFRLTFLAKSDKISTVEKFGFTFE
jgi:hypothetical protein